MTYKLIDITKSSCFGNKYGVVRVPGACKSTMTEFTSYLAVAIIYVARIITAVAFTDVRMRQAKIVPARQDALQRQSGMVVVPIPGTHIRSTPNTRSDGNR